MRSQPREKSSAEPGFRRLRALPPPLFCPPGPGQSRAHLSLRPAQGIFWLAGLRMWSLETGWQRPVAALSPARRWRWG